jgi:hypothetical protein
MIKENEYKKQGNGSDSWIVTEWEDASKKVMINKYMVYENPDTPVKGVDMSNVDLSTMTAEQMKQLKTALGL